jgi:hypothetical protein
VGNVYFNQRDNKNIAAKKISYFLEFIRSNFFLSTSNMNQEFVEALAKKTGLEEQEVTQLVNLIKAVNESSYVNDETLLELNKKIDLFHTRMKS